MTSNTITNNIHANAVKKAALWGATKQLHLAESIKYQAVCYMP